MQIILGDTATPESLAALERKLGLDRPPLQRYADWVLGAHPQVERAGSVLASHGGQLAEEPGLGQNPLLLEGIDVGITPRLAANQTRVVTHDVRNTHGRDLLETINYRLIIFIQDLR